MDTEPLFYQGADEFAAEVMATLSNEVVVNVRDAIKKMRPDLNLDLVVHISQWYIDCYAAQTDDSSCLLKSLQTNQGYRGLKHPMKKEADGKFMPNFQYRYMKEDLPMGL